MRLSLSRLLSLFAICTTISAATMDNELVKRQSSEDTQASGAGGTKSVVAFLQTLQAAQISSMSCLITLVNMTTNPIGTCLGLTTLSKLVVAPSSNSSFSNQLSTYLGTICASGQCSGAAVAEAKGQLADSCQMGSTDNTLISVLSAILDNYQNSYRTLACSVRYNGTADLCLAASLNTSQTANSHDFFNALVTGNNLESYKDSVFTSSQCTGCIHEIYKAAVYTLAAIRGKSITQAFGNHLQNDCQGQGGNIDWTNVQDEQIPDALVVQQATPGRPGGADKRLGRMEIYTSVVGLILGMTQLLL